MKYQFRARVTGSPVILDKCGEGYEAATEEEAWKIMMRAIALPQMDRARYSIEPFGQTHASLGGLQVPERRVEK